MDKKEIVKSQTLFDDASHTDYDTGTEFWYARELQKLLDYNEWRNFEKTIQKAIEACEMAGKYVPYHFVEVDKMITTGKGATREIRDYMLTRYACYLIAMNGDPRKPQIAFAQTYFALQTRTAELMAERLDRIERLVERGLLTEEESLF